MNYLIEKLTDLFGWISNGMIAFTGSDKLGLAYLLAIFIYTLIIKIVLLPLTIKQTRSTAKMSELQPKVKQIQDKYKNDPQKSQEQLMELYKKEGVSPFSGCLPLLIQFPLIIAMYRVLYNFKFESSFYNIVPWEYVKDFISKKTTFTPLLIIVVLIPLISGVTTYFQGIMMAPKGDDATAKQQRSMNTFMTIFTVYLGFKFHMSLVFYWIIQNILTVLQQYLIINKMKHKNEEA